LKPLPEDQQESLVDIVGKRLVERRRAALVRSVHQARREFKSGKLRPATLSEILHKVRA
jgi:hypothetical protein